MPSGLDFEAAGDSVVHLLFVQSFALRVSSRCKHDFGALMVKMRKHSKEHPLSSLTDLYMYVLYQALSQPSRKVREGERGSSLIH